MDIRQKALYSHSLAPSSDKCNLCAPHCTDTPIRKNRTNNLTNYSTDRLARCTPCGSGAASTMTSSSGPRGVRSPRLPIRKVESCHWFLSIAATPMSGYSCIGRTVVISFGIHVFGFRV